MAAALKAVKDGMPYKTASRKYSVTVKTLKRRAKGKNKIAVEHHKVLGSKTTVFSKEQEEELINHIIDMEERMYGLTIRDVLTLAYQLAERNGIKHPFSHDKKKVSHDKKKAGKRKRKKKPSGPKLLTSSPYKNDLEEEKKRRPGRENEKIKAAKKTNSKVQQKQKISKNKNVDSESSSDCQVDTDTECIYCRSKYSMDKRGKGWIRCCVCLRWGHDECAGVNSDDSEEFTCDFCLG